MLIILSVILVLLLIYMIVETFHLEITRQKIISPRLHSSDNLRIVFISDVHFGFFYHEKRLQKLIKVINEQKPDVVILGGDQIKRDKYDSLRFYQLFADGVQSKYGIYAVLGNHDYLEGKPDASLKAFKEAGIHSLNNKSHDIHHAGNNFRIGGTGDFWKGDFSFLPVYRNLNKNSFLIFVTHNPKLAFHISRGYRERIDLALCAHMHGRQLNLFNIPNPFNSYFPHHRGKCPLHNNNYLYISRGIGTSNIPLRFCARPELAIIDITGK